MLSDKVGMEESWELMSQELWASHFLYWDSFVFDVAWLIIAIWHANYDNILFSGNENHC
jgi:hypothetical protein